MGRNSCSKLETIENISNSIAQLAPFTVKENVEEVLANFYVIGDHRSSPTLNGAIASGRKVATLIEERLP